MCVCVCVCAGVFVCARYFCAQVTSHVQRLFNDSINRLYSFMYNEKEMDICVNSLYILKFSHGAVCV